MSMEVLITVIIWVINISLLITLMKLIVSHVIYMREGPKCLIKCKYLN